MYMVTMLFFSIIISITEILLYPIVKIIDPALFSYHWWVEPLSVLVSRVLGRFWARFLQLCCIHTAQCVAAFFICGSASWSHWKINGFAIFWGRGG